MPGISKKNKRDLKEKYIIILKSKIKKTDLNNLKYESRV